MKHILLLAAFAALALAPEAHAQRVPASSNDARTASGETAEAWYEVTSGDRSEMVRAHTITVRTQRGRTTAIADRQRLRLSGPLSVEFRGIYRPDEPEPRPRNSRGTAETITRGNITVTTELSFGADGKSVTTWTKVTVTNADGSTSSSTTTTTTVPDGDGGSTIIIDSEEN